MSLREIILIAPLVNDRSTQVGSFIDPTLPSHCVSCSFVCTRGYPHQLLVIGATYPSILNVSRSCVARPLWSARGLVFPIIVHFGP